MQNKIWLLLLLIGLAGCAASPTPDGNLAQKTASSLEMEIANDVVKKLVTLYPPISTHFDLQQATPDLFGTYLIESMRLKGYGVLEFKSKTSASTAPAPAVLPSPSEFPLSYIMDQIKGTDLYRVTLVINNQQSLDRVYQLRDGSIFPAGYWVRKE